MERKHAPRMVQLAKKRLGLTGKKNRVLFDVLAQHYGEARVDKKRGLDLVYRFVGEHKGTPLPKSKKDARRTIAPAPPHEDFLQSYEWRRLRMEVLVERGAKCECCGATPKDGAVMNVDHIKPRLRFPHLKLEKSNLQVLCAVCNHGKGNWDETDWRQEGAAVVAAPAPPIDPMAPRLVKFAS